MDQVHNEAVPVLTVRGVQFGILSPEEIVNLSACEVVSDATHRQDGTPEVGGLFDLRMGPTEPGQRCQTCGNDSTDCEGHFGYIELSVPVAHNGYFRETRLCLSCVCHTCSRILLPDSDIRTLSYPKDQRLTQLKALTKKAKSCPHCGAPRLNMVNKSDDRVVIKYTETDPLTRRQRELTMAGAREILQRIPTSDVRAMGYLPEHSRPENQIMTHMLIPPPVMRPSTLDSRDQAVEDDIFHSLRRIIRSNIDLAGQIRSGQVKEGVVELFSLNVNSLFDSSGKAGGGTLRFKLTNKERRGIRQTLEKKSGRVYQNIMGKRQDWSARSVGGGEILCDINEVLVPQHIAENWRIIETVNKYNVDRLQSMVLRREYPCASYVRQDGKYINIQNMKPIDLKNVVLRPGNQVERQVIDGDWTIYNRMPSLHRPSMLAAKIRVDRGSERRHGLRAHRRVLGEDIQSGMALSQTATAQGSGEEEIWVPKVMSIKVNPCTCAPLNLDFDGDELNLILSRTQDVIAELAYLMNSAEHMVSSKNGMALIALMQDGLLGSYLMSTEGIILNRHVTSNLLGVNPYYDHTHRPLEPSGVADRDLRTSASPQAPVYISRGEPFWTSRQIFSTVLPGINFDDGKLQIVNGTITRGSINKDHMAKDKGTLLLAIHHDYGATFAAEFLSIVMRMCVYLVTHIGATISLSDFDISRESKDGLPLDQEVANVIEATKTRCSGLLYQLRTGTFIAGLGQNILEEYEMLASNYMSNTVSLTASAVDRAVQETEARNGTQNQFLVIAAKAASKGSAQQYRNIVSHIGQQNVGSHRVARVYYGRSMSCFHHGTDTPESRGFVGDSYLSGVDPLGYVFHQMNARNSLIDKVVEVSESGYLAKKLGKCMEDVLVTYDMTVRNIGGRIIQTLHGEDGCNVAKVEKVSLDIFSLTDQQLREQYPDSEDQAALTRDRAWLRDCFLKTGPKVQTLTLSLPFNAKRVFLNCRKGNEKGVVSLKRARELLDAFLEELPALYHNKETIEEADDIYDHAVRLTQIQVRSVFAPSIVSGSEKGLTEAELEAALDTCRRKFIRSLLHPGEMIGSLTAQCLAEENTQLMLNSVHALGAKAKSGMIGGVKRLNEIIRITRKPQSPVMYIYLKERFRGDKQLARQFASQIEHTTLENLAKKAELIFDRDPFGDSDIQEDRAFIRDFRRGMVGQTSLPPNATRWVLRVVLDRDRLLMRRVRTLRILEVLHGHPRFWAICSDDNAEQVVLRVVLLTQKSEVMQPDQARALKEELLNTTIYGIAGIRDVAVREQKLLVEDPKTGGLLEETEYFMDTTGSNISEIMAMPFVDQRRTRSNDIYETYMTMGLEPCRRVIYNELQGLFGENVDPRVLLVLTDFMTQRGRPVQINSSGLKVSTDSALTRITFEKNYERLINSSMRGHLDPMTSVSGNIMFGQIIKGGTGYFNLTYDERTSGVSAVALADL